jgi:phosphatidylinositol alpha-mannosyltransferase
MSIEQRYKTMPVKYTPKKLKIGLVCDDSLDKTDGVQQYVLTLGAWLTRQGHEVHYLTSTTTRTDIPHVHSLCRNIAVRFNGNRNNMPLPASYRRIKRFLATEQFDVLHIQMPYSPLLAGMIIRAAVPSTAIVGTFHIFPHSKLVEVGARALGGVVRPQMKRFTTIMSVSSAAQAFAEQSFSIDSHVIPNMVDVSRFITTSHKETHPKKVRIVFLGRLVERKGPLQLLQAVSYMRQNCPPTHPYTITIGGKGPLLDELVAYQSEHRLTDVTSFVGFVSEETKPDFLQAADIAVFPSTGGESFGISLVEAMAAVPGVVLAGDNAGYRTVMKGAEKQLFDPNNIEMFAKLLSKYIDDEPSREKAHKWQKGHVKQYDIDTVCPQIIDIYRQALQARSK